MCRVARICVEMRFERLRFEVRELRSVGAVHANWLVFLERCRADSILGQQCTTGGENPAGWGTLLQMRAQLVSGFPVDSTDSVPSEQAETSGAPAERIAQSQAPRDDGYTRSNRQLKVGNT